MSRIVRISGVDFEIPSVLSTEPINSYFRPFHLLGRPDSLCCAINSFDECPALNEYPLSEKKWSSQWSDGKILLTRWNEFGAILWQATMPADASEISVQLNPELWKQHYFSLDDLLWRDLALFIIPLRLRLEDGLLLHGAGAVLDEHGILCVGHSGAGKTTLSTLMRCCGAEILSDEHPVVRYMTSGDDDFRVYGSPWPSCGGYVSSDSSNLKRIYFLEHGSENAIISVSRGEAMRRILQVATILWDCEELIEPWLKTVENLVSTVPAAVLSFRPDEAVVDVIRQDLAAERVIV